MAVSIISNFVSNSYYSSANPIAITVDSTESGNCNFRYICDIYINGTKVFTQKLFPDPQTGYGFFQIDRIVNDYIQTSVPKSPQTNYFALSAQSTAPTSLVSVQCKFGQEYDSSNDCQGVVNQYLNQVTSNTIDVFEAAFSYEDWPSFDYNNYTFAITAKTASFLTNSPREVDVNLNDTYYLDFISTQSLTSSRVLVVETYDTFYDSLINQYTLASTSLSSTKRYKVACGPYDLNNIYGGNPIITQTVAYYKVYIALKVGANLTRLTEIFTFNIKPPSEFVSRFAFIGLLGGIEHFTFYHRNVGRYDLERKTYEQHLLSNYSSLLDYQVGDRGTTQYGIRARESRSVSTFCSREVSEWLNEMWLSPTVWTYKRPELLEFTMTVSGSKILIWSKDHNLKVGDSILIFPETYAGDEVIINGSLEVRKTILSLTGDNIIDCGLTAASFPNRSTTPCGWIQKVEDWKMLPIIINDNQIEIKQKMTRPIEYGLNYQMAYNKNTLR